MWHFNHAPSQADFFRTSAEDSSNQFQIDTSAPPPQLQSPQLKLIRETAVTAIGILTLVSILLLLRRMVGYWKSNSAASVQEIHSSQIQVLPCQRCRYFNPSAFLYCAVRPTTAMTQEALHCPDFDERHAAAEESFIIR